MGREGRQCLRQRRLRRHDHALCVVRDGHPHHGSRGISAENRGVLRQHGSSVAKQPGIEFTAGEVVGTVSADGASVTVTWPPAITQPAGGAVTYQLTLWDLAGCPLQGASCNGHAFIPPQGTCAATATACKVPFAQIVPPLTAENLQSLSVVAVDSGAPPPPPQAMIQGNVTPLVGGGPFGEIRSGTAIGVGLAETAQGRGRGQ